MSTRSLARCMPSSISTLYCVSPSLLLGKLPRKHCKQSQLCRCEGRRSINATTTPCLARNQAQSTSPLRAVSRLSILDERAGGGGGAVGSTAESSEIKHAVDPTNALDTSSPLSSSDPPLPPARNKKLAAVIREGIASLNQSALAIQNNPHTNKPIFSTSRAEEGSSSASSTSTDPRRLAEEHRIFTTAQDCLDEICLRDPTFPLMAADEPILLLGVKVKPSLSHADIYWALPYRILQSHEVSSRQKEILRDEMNERVQGAPGRSLIRRINAVLSSYFPPKLRFQAAPPLLIESVLRDLEND